MGTTPNAPIGTNKISGVRSKTWMRMQQIARYRITGRLTDAQIAERVGLTAQGIARVLATPEYRDLEEELLQGHISKMDEALAGNIDELHTTMRTAVPLAMRTLIETVQQRRDLRAAMAAANEILDRDPDRTFTKISKNADGKGGSNEFNPGSDAKLVASLTTMGNAVAVQIQATSGANPTVTATTASANGATTIKAQTASPQTGADSQIVAPIASTEIGNA